METIQFINNSLSGILSVGVSLITAIVTTVYVVFTYKQMKATQAASSAAISQIRLNNQPCIIVEKLETSGSACFSGKRRQLNIDLMLDNVGDSPAISVYTFAHFELQHTKNVKDRVPVVDMDYIPDFVQCIKPGASTAAYIRFETSQINMLVEDLRVCHMKNVERLKTNPHQSPHMGTNLIVEIYYKNILGQWFKYVTRQEILWLVDKHAPPRKTHNLNENTIPPRLLADDTEFELQIASPKMSVANIELVDINEISQKMAYYKEDVRMFNFGPFKEDKTSC